MVDLFLGDVQVLTGTQHACHGPSQGILASYLATSSKVGRPGDRRPRKSMPNRSDQGPWANLVQSFHRAVGRPRLLKVWGAHAPSLRQAAIELYLSTPLVVNSGKARLGARSAGKFCSWRTRQRIPAACMRTDLTPDNGRVRGPAWGYLRRGPPVTPPRR